MASRSYGCSNYCANVFTASARASNFTAFHLLRAFIYYFLNFPSLPQEKTLNIIYKLSEKIGEEKASTQQHHLECEILKTCQLGADLVSEDLGDDDIALELHFEVKIF